MDADRAKYLRTAKEEAAKWLAENWFRCYKKHPRIQGADKRLDAYLRVVSTHPDSHNLFEILAVKRFLCMLDKYRFSAASFRNKLTVLESIPMTTPKGFAPLTLSPIQVFAIAGMYGFRKADGRRLVTKSMLFVPRKFGKTTFSAGLAIEELLCGDADAQVYTCANSYQQAKICFDNIRKSLKRFDRTGQRFRVNREAIYNQMKGRSSFARCLAADPTTLDGLNASLYILDEFSQSKSADLRNVMSTSTGTRNNPMEIIITTASDLLDSPCVDTLKAYQEILFGNMEDDSVFALILQPDVDDREDDPKTWKKVQPHLGVTVKEDYYEQKYAEALQTNANMLAFRTKLLNVFAINESKAWITSDEVKNLYKPFDFSKCQGRPYCMVAFDLSVWDDFSAVCYGIYDSAAKSFHFHNEYYLPAETLVKHPNRDLYQRWVEKGFLTVIPGKVIDYDRIVRDIVSRNGQVLIAGIGYDPYKSQEAINMLTAMGAQSVLRPIKQTYGEFTAPVEAMEMMIKTGKCSFSPNDITAYCFGNCVMDEDRNGNKKPIKKALSNKIDGAIACLMSQYMFSKFKR